MNGTRSRRLRDRRGLRALARLLEGPGPGGTRKPRPDRGLRRPIRRRGPIAWLARLLVLSAVVAAVSFAWRSVSAPGFAGSASRAWAGFHTYFFDTDGVPPGPASGGGSP